MRILIVLVVILGVVIVASMISFFLSVPHYLDRIADRMYERNKIEKEKLDIMKENKNNNNNK